MEKTWRIIDLVKWGEEYLNQKGIESSRLKMEMIIGKVLDLKRIDLYLKFDQPLLKNELEELRALVKRLASHEPVQYIIGHTDFYGLKIITEPGVLIPRPETEELCKIIIDSFGSDYPESILEIGTGSACIALALAKNFPNSEVYSIDVSDEALKIAEKNQRVNKISNVKFFKMNILEKLPKKKFPLIVSNPPYIASKEIDSLDENVKKYEPHLALSDGSDGLEFYRRFADNFDTMLEPGGDFYLELNEDLAKKINNLFIEKKRFKTEIIQDIFSKNRFLKGKLI